MSFDIEDRMHSVLSHRQETGTLRALKIIEGIDFCSNDYLGLAKDTLDTSEACYGSTGSRLISGHNQDVDTVETMIAKFHGYDSALLFGSGYAANSGLLACLGARGDVIITDELIHASLIDGARLSYAKRVRFAHNDMTDLEQKLISHAEKKTGQIFVVVESLYSMDGDFAPLKKISALCEAYRAAMIVDEAHSVGICGPEGRGLISDYGLQDKTFATIYTFGKAVGLHGAIICSSNLVRKYLINFCRPFIYSTAPSPHTIACTSQAYQRMIRAEKERQSLGIILDYFAKKSSHAKCPDGVRWLPSKSPIQGLIVPGNERAKALGLRLQERGYGVKAILSPTVPEGEERLRLSLHSFNTTCNIDGLFSEIEAFFEEATP